MAPPPFSASALEELRAFCAAAKSDPGVLHHASLGELRELLTRLGGKLPPAPAAAPPPSPAPAGNEDLRDEECVEADTPTQECPTSDGSEPSDEVMEACSAAKSAAAEAASNGDWAAAIASYTLALKAMPSALTFAKRAECYLKLKQPNAAIRDADAALALNADSAKAYKARGTAHRLLGSWEAAAKDLGTAQNIDFDDAVAAPLKLVVEKAGIVRKRRVEAENAEKQRRLDEAKAARAAREAAAASAAAGGGMGGGFPGMGGMGGFPGGMGGMGGMGGFPGMGGMGGGMPNIPPEMLQALMSDPELMSAMMDPSVQSKLQECMRNPSKLAEYQSDPKMGSIISKLMGLMGGGGMGGMGGGMGGTGGFGGGAPSSGVQFEEVDDDDDDMPPLHDEKGPSKFTSVDDVD